MPTVQCVGGEKLLEIKWSMISQVLENLIKNFGKRLPVLGSLVYNKFSLHGVPSIWLNDRFMFQFFVFLCFHLLFFGDFFPQSLTADERAPVPSRMRATSWDEASRFGIVFKCCVYRGDDRDDRENLHTSKSVCICMPMSRHFSRETPSAVRSVRRSCERRKFSYSILFS